MKAIIAGAFDPFTLGHRDLVMRAVKVFGNATVAVAADTGKHCASLYDRTEIVKASVADIPQADVVPFDGLLSDFLTSNMPCVLVRGLRGNADFEYERDLGRIYADLCDAECVYLVSDPEKSHISSTAVRQLAALGAELEKYAAHDAVNMIGKVYGKKERK